MQRCWMVAQLARQLGSGTGAAEVIPVNATKTVAAKDTMENFIFDWLLDC